ncbi:glycosyltransferase [Methanobrevibacter millerae]|uniref:Glycosyl transferase GT2 family n=1 Tax=Methanobrevibacter millerae TaxID=230361 RepID=A0A0U2TVH0_9EURY|nr:glycosyltransferase [Methanobrevibacter millerae]ALT69747.1 glycosyl transferase GT2 family [Methanobrevibacter millerae]
MNNPKVSIIIPVYNSESLLTDCLMSVKNQTLSDIEIICIDDGSTDNSFKILKDFSNGDKRFKIFHQENSGAGFSRNVALEKVTGDFVLFLDSDDWIEKDTCEKLYNQAINLHSDLVLFDAVRHLPDNQSMDLIHFLGVDSNKDFSSLSFDYKLVKNKVLNAYFGVIWSKFYKSSFIFENNIKFPYHKLYNDVEFHVKSMLLAKRISYFPKIFYHYNRIGQDSLQTLYVSSSEAIVFYDVMCGIKEFLLENNFFDEFKLEFIEFTFKEFERKLNEIDDEFKLQYFEKIKLFLKSLNISAHDLNKISFYYLVFYIHSMISENYAEFKLMQDNYNGDVSLDDLDDISYSEKYLIKDYLFILENNFSQLVNYSEELEYYLNFYKQKSLSNKKLINHYSSDEVMHLNDMIKYLNQQNDYLMDENLELKNQLNESIISKIIKKISGLR